MQRSEYLGGVEFPINIDQVIQTSSTVQDVSAQGNDAAYSLTGSSHADFTKSFEEHGILLGLINIRISNHTYQQRIPKLFSKLTRTQLYFPVFSNLGEVPILKKEIYTTGNQANDDKVFGYQEAWYEYRYKPSAVTGEMRSNASNTQDIYHYADVYTSEVTLNNNWIQEQETQIDRNLTIPSTSQNQFKADFYFQETDIRPMPLHSVPGLIDHN